MDIRESRRTICVSELDREFPFLEVEHTLNKEMG